MPSSWFLPTSLAAPYPASTFQRAPPEANGLGVITSTPGWVRSSQSVRCFGLPFRVAMTTTESVTMPACSSEFQSSATIPALTTRVMSGSREKATMSAGRPDSTARLWSPEPPNDVVNSTFRPASVFWYAAMMSSYASCGVEYATSASVTFSSSDDAPASLPQAASANTATLPAAIKPRGRLAINVYLLDRLSARPYAASRGRASASRRSVAGGERRGPRRGRRVTTLARHTAGYGLGLSSCNDSSDDNPPSAGQYCGVVAWRRRGRLRGSRPLRVVCRAA